ncbi:uncharacterized protein PFB0765w-like [Hyposmocoma kahamanoa]|uniref:uncharacterized protein PFB0765w-like n=1 Tax=Hyposmocoma kahamanoa TaxID=1477025 RepID=UPI000E6D8F31|nr:uncharacterized protein PFB0765w-like [Hyposmocoma kahamanoa]
MKFIVVVIFMLATQASTSFLDKVRGIFQPPKYDVVNFVADVVSDLQESIDCTIMAVENVFSLGGMFAINPEYERRCKSMTKDFTVTPAAEDTYYSQETDTSNAHRLQTLKEMRRGNENATNEISKHVKESLIDASSTLKLIVKKNEAQKKVQNVKSVIKNETDRLVVISKMIRRELDDLSPETKSKFNIHDIDLEHVSVHEVLGEIGALYKVEQSDKSSSHANEIRHLFDKILNIVRVNKNDDRVYSDDEEVKEIVKNLEKTENNTLINTAEKLSIWKDGNLQNNIVHNENINKLQKEIDNIPKTFQDIAKRIFNQGSANVIRRSNASEIINTLNVTPEVKIQNMNVRKTIQNTAKQIMNESNTIDMNQILKSNQQARNIFNKSIKEQNSDSLESFHKNKDKILKLSMEQKQNLNITNRSQDTAIHVLEESHIVDTDRIVKSTAEAINIISHSDNQQQKYYIPNMAQTSVDDMAEKKYLNVDIIKSFQHTTSQIVEESKIRDKTKEHGQAFVSNSAPEENSNALEASKKQKENVNVANRFESISNQVMEDLKSVDIDQIVKSAEEATKIFSQASNDQQNYYVSNIVQTSIDDIFQDSEKEFKNIDVANSFQNTVSHIMEESKTENTTKAQEEAFISNSIQENVNNIFDDLTEQKENLDLANSFQSIANEIIEKAKPVDTDNIVKTIEEAINISSQSPNEQQKYYDSNIEQASVFQNTASKIMEGPKTVDSTKEQEQAFASNSIQESANNIFENSRKQKENVDIASSFQSIANEAIEVSKPVDIDDIVKSTEEATNIYSQSSNEQQNYYVSNIVQASVDDIFKDSEKEYQNVGVVDSFQNAASEVMELLKIENTTKEQEQAFVSNSIQESANNIFEDSRKQKENVDIASSFQSIANELIENAQPVDTDQIVKSTEEATNIFSQSANEQQKYYDSNIEQASVDDIFKDSEKEYQNIDVANSFQNTISQIMEESKTENTTKEHEQAFVSDSNQENVDNIFEDSRKQKENLDLANRFQSIADDVIDKAKPVDTDQIVKTIEEAMNIFGQSPNEQRKYYDSNIVQESVDDIFQDSEKEFKNIDVVNSFQNAATQVMEESTTENTTKEQEQAFVSSIIQESANNIFEDSRKQEENEDIESSFQSIANEVIEKAKPVDTDQIVKTVKEATNIFSQSANEQQTYYVSNNVQASIDDMFKDSEKEYQNIDVVNSFQNAASQIIEESKTENTTKEQEQVFDSNNTQEKVSNTFEDLEQRKEDVDIANSFQSITNQVVEEFKPVDTYQIVKLTEEALNIFNQSTNEQNSFQNTVSQITEGKVTVDSTKSQGHAFVSNDVQVNKKLENTKKVKANVNVVNSFQSIATQMPKKLKSAYKQQKVNSTKEAMNISHLTKDQKKSLHSSQDNLNKTFKQLKSEVPQPSVPAHAQGLNGIGVNPPISKNYMSRAPSIPPPAVTSAHTTTSTTTTTTTEIPDYDDYDEETDTDGLSLLSLFFGSGSEEDNAMSAKEAESIIERSRHSKEYFNKVNMKNARNVFANP